MSAALEQLSEEFVALVAPRLVDVLVAAMAARPMVQTDPLLTVTECAKRIGVGRDKIYELVKAGALLKAPGIREIRIRQSILDAYGK